MESFTRNACVPFNLSECPSVRSFISSTRAQVSGGCGAAVPSVANIDYLDPGNAQRASPLDDSGHKSRCREPENNRAGRSSPPPPPLRLENHVHFRWVPQVRIGRARRNLRTNSDANSDLVGLALELTVQVRLTHTTTGFIMLARARNALYLNGFNSALISPARTRSGEI